VEEMNIDSSGGIGDGCENAGHDSAQTPNSECATTPPPAIESKSDQVEDPLDSVPVHDE
jgi:hypothetical protein